MQTKEIFHIPARKVKAVSGYPVNSFEDIKELRKLGIALDSSVATQMFNAVKHSFAMDSDLVAPLSTPSVTTPIQFLQAWMPGQVFVTTRAQRIDELVGVTTIGSYESEEVIQAFAERSGRAKVYADQANFHKSNWNMNFERRTVVRFEEGFEVKFLEERRAAAMNANAAKMKRQGATDALNIERNYVGFYGYNSGLGRTYGYLNDPSLPAYVNVPNGAGGSPLWAQKTANEIIADILTAAQALRTQSGDLIDPTKDNLTLGAATAVRDRLNTPSQLTNYSVQQWLNDNYPNIRIVSAPELNAANGGANVFYLHAEDFGDGSTDDGRVWVQMVPTKYITLGVQQLTKGFEEDYGAATAGVMLKRPWAVVRYSGV